jgi:hypothetical protein
MERMPPDPAANAEYQREMREFAEKPPYPVHGLRRPVLAPAILGAWETVNGRTTSVSVCYGCFTEPAEPPPASGRVGVPPGRQAGGVPPFVRVDSGPPGSAGGPPVDLLAALLDESRLSLPGGAEPVHERTDQGELCTVGDAWALRLAADGQAVTVLGRGVDPREVELEPIGDLLPYVAERNAFMARLAAGASAPPEPQPAPAHGIAAVRAFLETFVPGGPEAAGAAGALGRRAVAELDGVLGCGPSRARYLVFSMVNQITQMRQSLPWFSAPDGPRAAAVEELLRHQVLDQPVDSESAQLLWDQYWSAQQRAVDADFEWLHGLWVEAWTEWEQAREEEEE